MLKTNKNEFSKQKSSPSFLLQHPLILSPYPLKQIFKNLLLLIPTDLVPPQHRHTRHRLDALFLHRRLRLIIDKPPVIAVPQVGTHQIRREAGFFTTQTNEEVFVGNILAVEEVSAEQGLYHAGLGGWASPAEDVGDEDLGGARGPGDAGDGEGEAVGGADGADAVEVWLELVGAAGPFVVEGDFVAF